MGLIARPPQVRFGNPINAHSSQKQPGNFNDIFQAKALLEKYLMKKY